jgi:hypothetical protein
MTITLLQLRTQSRQRADMESSEFIADSELNSYINASIAELHDILAQAYGSDYFVTTDEFTTAQNTASYDLPDDFYKLHGVDAALNGSDFVNIKRFNFNERNRFNDLTVWNLMGVPSIRYRIVGNQIQFSPPPDRNITVKLWYTPVAAKLAADGDTLDDFNQYSEYVVVDAAIKMLQKEESDVQVLMAQKMALIDRITKAANNRDAGEPESVSDIYSENDEYYFRS